MRRHRAALIAVLAALATPVAAQAQTTSCGVCPGVVTQTPNKAALLHPNLVPNVTYYLDVDGGTPDSALPTPDTDISVRVQVVDVQKPTLTVQKLTPGAQLPLRVETVVRSSSTSPWLSGGYDGRTTSAPDSFSVALDLSNRDGNAATDQALADASIVGAPASLTLLSEQFTGSPAGSRTNRTIRSLKFVSDTSTGAQVPTHIVADITRAAKSTRVKVTRDLPTRLEYDMTAPSAPHLSGHVYPLPNNVDLTLSNDVPVTNSNGTTEVIDKKVDYSADGTTDLAFTSAKSGESTTITADDLPSVAHVTYSTDDANNPKVTYHANDTTPSIGVTHTQTRVVNNVSQKLTVNGTITGLPANINSLSFTHDANGATAAYQAGGGIGSISLKTTLTGATFFGRVNRLEATITNVPASNTIRFTKADGGIVTTATNAIGGTTTLLASSGAAAPPVSGSYAWYEDTSSLFRAFVRINGLKGVTFKANPVTGTLDTTAAQVFGLHGVTGGVTLDGVIDKLPSHVEFSAPSDRVHIQYTGSPISHVNLTAKGLPAAAKFANAKVDVYGISPVLDVYLGVKQSTTSSLTASGDDANATNCPSGACEPACDPRIPHDCDTEPEPNPQPRPAPDPELFGIDAHGNGISRIAVHAWANNADLPSHPDLPATNNDVRFDGKLAGHEDLRVNIVNLKRALYTRDSAPDHGDDVLVEFTQAAPIALGLKRDTLDGTVTIPAVSGRQLPTKYGLHLTPGYGTKAVFTPNATIPKVLVNLAVGRDVDGQRGALITGTVQNIPTQTTVCLRCGNGLHTAPKGGASNRGLTLDGGFVITSNGPPVTDPQALRVDARVCLGNLDGAAWTPANCLNDRSAVTYIDIRNLRIRNADLEYNSDSSYKYSEGSDPSFAFYANTDGILVDRLRYVKDNPTDDDYGTGVEFVKTGSPLTAQDYFIAANYSVSVRAGIYEQSGTLSCPPSTGLYVLQRGATTGNVWHEDVWGPDNLWYLAEEALDC